MRRFFQRLALVAGLITTCYAVRSTPAAGLDAPKRIVSVNLCADQMLIELADPTRIVALGPFSREPLLSFLADRAQAFPQISNRTENLLHMDADAVVVGPFDNMYMRSALRRQGIREMVVGRWISLNEVKQGITNFSDGIDQARSGARLIEEIETSVAELKDLVTSVNPYTFLILQRRGYVGEGEIVAELLELAGLANAAKGASAQFLSVESVIALRPSVLVVSGRDVPAKDRGLALLEHPALTRLYPSSRRITAPDRLVICGGPSTPSLIRHLKSELMAWRGNR